MAQTAVAAVSAVLPAYNEEANLARTVQELAPALGDRCQRAEIIIVDDGSTDGTAVVAERLAGEIRGVRVVTHLRNRGYGGALRSGFDAARLDWILLLDADGQFVIDELDRLIEAAPEADLVIGVRRRRADPFHRRWFAGTWRLLMRVFFGIRVRDVNCGFKLMRTASIQSLGLESDGAFISAEFLARAARRGARIVEVPVTHVPRAYGRQTGGDPRILLRAFVDLGRLWWRIRRTGQTAVGVERRALS